MGRPRTRWIVALNASDEIAWDFIQATECGVWRLNLEFLPHNPYGSRYRREKCYLKIRLNLVYLVSQHHLPKL